MKFLTSNFIIKFLLHLPPIFALQDGVMEDNLRFTLDDLKNAQQTAIFQRPAFKNTRLELKFRCEFAPPPPQISFQIQLAVRSSPCLNEFFQVLNERKGGDDVESSTFSAAEQRQRFENLNFYFEDETSVVGGPFSYTEFWHFSTKMTPLTLRCLGHFVNLPNFQDRRLNLIKNAKPWPNVTILERRKRETFEIGNFSKSIKNVENLEPVPGA
uniref:TMEM87A/B GOLD domain-containing protein n=1 Tax=Romanomermis culicivorax TaxID=13658 RepID=A0A915KDJ9_ROMCU